MKTFTDSKTYGLFSTAANRKIIKNLENGGAKVFLFPPIETEKLETAENNALITNNLSKFDWIIFPDVFAVEYFLEILEAHRIDLFELDEKRILAFGEAVSDKLRFAQIHADVIPNSIEVEDVFTAILNYAGNTELAELYFLMSKEIVFQTELTHKLTEAGAKVTELNIYQTKNEHKNEITKLKTLLKGGAIDEFLFSSPEDIYYLQNYFIGEKLSKVLIEIEVFSTNEITMQTLRENNLLPKHFSVK